MITVGFHLLKIVIIIAILPGAAMKLEYLYWCMMQYFYNNFNQCCVFPHMILYSFSSILKIYVSSWNAGRSI